MKEDKQMAVEDKSDVIKRTVHIAIKVFKCFKNLEIHLGVGKHTNALEHKTLYDSLRNGPNIFELLILFILF